MSYNVATYYEFLNKWKGGKQKWFRKCYCGIFSLIMGGFFCYWAFCLHLEGSVKSPGERGEE